ncbi:MAG: hypothetical protein IPP22_13140 [Nitrosomonas sp.]|nr:hypothetical protein [Nitrosomonas sp.]
MNINLHIERLVLDGVNVESDLRRMLQATVEAELTRLLTEGGISPSLAQGVALPRISADGIQLTDNKPVQIGQQIAQSVYGGIGHE